MAEAIATIFAIGQEQIDVSTYGLMESQFKRFVDLFIKNGTRSISYDNGRILVFDYTKFDNLVYQQPVVQTFAFINQNIFHYDVQQEELLYDWKKIDYEINCQNSNLLLKIRLVNNYNEMVDYILEVKII